MWIKPTTPVCLKELKFSESFERVGANNLSTDQKKFKSFEIVKSTSSISPHTKLFKDSFNQKNTDTKKRNGT